MKSKAYKMINLKQRRVGAVLLAALLLGACGPGEEVAEEILRPVRYTTLSDQGELRDRSFSGTSKSSRESPSACRKHRCRMTGTIDSPRI